ncbi:roadblock/LC7 domain-containing protein [Methanoregula sp.]|uniref:roadblock/LC7 domain-containing protein n=1 Tax=Methanoregula sp. TaxID=2052170 RepID=UPI002BE17562|nr:roadblock/LC7 domain-containing protein [Methanoregula sp.]HVP97215.1 roadblock/LC7 domain-containing protein [Methanoregula sp.]
MPAGTQGGVAFDPKKGDMIQHLREFRGIIEIETVQGKGFLLMRNGELVAAQFEGNEGTYRGNDAVRYIMAVPERDRGPLSQKFTMRAYSDQDYTDALNVCTKEGLFIGSAAPGTDVPPSPTEKSKSSRTAPCIVDKGTLNKIMNQPGVIAVSAFYEGFPVLSLGKADFEHVAARAEDLLRAGTRIAEDMDLGQPDQLILETGENKFIIVPCGDLFLCIIARADAQLGLLRVLIRSIQNDVRGGS